VVFGRKEEDASHCFVSFSAFDHYFIDSRGGLEEVLVEFGVSGGRQIFACRFDFRNDVLIRWAGPLD
jgi:hypothetical protein